MEDTTSSDCHHETKRVAGVSTLAQRSSRDSKTDKPHKIKPSTNRPLRSTKRRRDELAKNVQTKESNNNNNHHNNKSDNINHAGDDDDNDDDDDDDDDEEVERKIEALQRIVPGGERLGVDKLFEETAGYIMALQCQLKAMRTLANLFQGLEKEKTKFGG